MLVYIPEQCRSRRRADLEIEGVEVVWVEIWLHKKAILLSNIYRPPNANTNYLTNIELMMEKVASECRTTVLMGDLNLNLLAPSTQVENLLIMAIDHNLKQLISQPTRITNHSLTLLDVLFTSDPELFLSTGTVEFIGSDHLMIYGETL